MKRRYIAILIISLTTWLYACETEMMGYEGESGVYFMMQKPPASGYGDPEQYEYVDTTLIPFAMFTAKDTVLPIRVRITGEVADHDRYFTIRVVDTLTTAKEGEDYEPFENSQVVRSQIVDTNGQGHGALAGFLTEAGVDVLICGGIGGGAQSALATAGIKLYGGVSGAADEAVEAYLAGKLDYNPDVRCSHHEHEHSCGEHKCGEDKHGCAGNEMLS